MLFDAADLLFREVQIGKQASGKNESFYEDQKSYDGDSFSSSKSDSEPE